MSSHTKSLGPNTRLATGSRHNRIWRLSLKELFKTQANMCCDVNKAKHNDSLLDKQFPLKNTNIGHLSAKIVINSVAKGASKSNHVPTSNGMKRHIASSFEKCSILVEKQKKSPTRSGIDGKDELNERRKREVNDASHPSSLKAMPELLRKTTGRLGHYRDSSSQSKKRESSDKEEAITSSKYNTTKLESVPNDSCTTEGNKKPDEIAIAKEKVEEFGKCHKEGDTTKAKHPLDFTSSVHCNSRSISYPFGKDSPKLQKNKTLFLDDNHSINLTFENVEKRDKKRKEPLSEENPKKALDDHTNVVVQVDNKSCKQMKKLKQSRVTRKDEADGGCNLNHVGVEDDSFSISKNDQTKVSMSSCIERQCYSCSKPIDKPTWSGIFKIDNKKYVSLDGHLSTKSCEKAWNLSRQLLKVVEVKKFSRLEVWPKAWEITTPTGNDIFLPHEMRQDEELDQLVREVMENDLALRAIIDEVEMLIFPSILLPNHHQTFQRKHYLWGVFKCRQDKVAMVGHYDKEKQQNLCLNLPNTKLPGEDSHQDMIWMASTVPVERHMFPPNKSTQEVEASHLKGPTKMGFDLNAPGEEGGHAETTPVTTGAATFLASHGQVNPSMGHTPNRLMGFVVRKTSKLDRIIQEIEREGALVFAMQGEMVGAESWAVSKAAVTQQ